ncbi:MAG: M48 family metallopeptidase [Candidatus Methanosuratincola sp.]|jgi:predicted Zn-dependent protease
MKRKALYVAAATLTVFIATLYGCYKAPITGRSQLILVSPQEEREMGLLAFSEIRRKERVSTDPVFNNYVGRVVERIARASGKPEYEWEYMIIKKDNVVNAFALPGGKVGVYTGILPIARTEAGLATVIGHEVAHATARHGAERITVGMLAQLGAIGLGAALSRGDPRIAGIMNDAYGLGVTVGAILPFSRSQEAEADRIGLIYMAKAGYNPKEAIYFWDRMEEATRDKPTPPEFLSTHPGYNTRRKNLIKWQPEAMYYYMSAPKAPNDVITAVLSQRGGLSTTGW